MGMKEQRQSTILGLIQKQDIETQEDLAQALENEGFRVTQATVSRDIRELKLTKVALRVFRDAFVSMDFAGNIVVIRTLTGMGNAVASAIDAFNFSEIVGTLAGDDTIFCAVKHLDHIEEVMNQFRDILNS